MRLTILNDGHRPAQKMALRLARATSTADRTPGPMATLSYRRRFLGKQMAGCLQEAMREAEHWPVAELELMAAFVSNLNNCEACAVDHAAVAAGGLSGSLSGGQPAAVLDDWRTADISERLRATLGFLEKVTLTPDAVGPSDIGPLRAAGVSDEAVAEALYVGFVFDTMNRFAGAFDFPVPSPAESRRTAKFLRRFGYRFASLPG